MQRRKGQPRGSGDGAAGCFAYNSGVETT